MSLVSASGFIGGIKEYTYRGIQQLPLVLTSTSLIFMITTGSMAHTNMALGLALLMPVYTLVLQTLLKFILNGGYGFVIFIILGLSLMVTGIAEGVAQHGVSSSLSILSAIILFVTAGFSGNSAKDFASWSRSTGDTCDIVSSYQAKRAEFYLKPSGTEAVPSFWLMSLAFFIGYSLTNAVDNLTAPAQPSSDENGHEKRTTQSVIVIVSTLVFALIVLYMRFTYMRGCEGRGTLGILLSVISSLGAMVIGYGTYTLSKQCGARSSDLFGIMSQIIPVAATTSNPIVCASE